MTENALRWLVDSPALMLEQVERIARLVEAQDRERVRIGVIPQRQVVDIFPMTSFDIYDNTAAVVGAGFGTSFLNRPLDVAGYATQLARLVELAVFGEDAAVVLRRIAEDYRS